MFKLNRLSLLHLIMINFLFFFFQNWYSASGNITPHFLAQSGHHENSDKYGFPSYYSCLIVLELSAANVCNDATADAAAGAKSGNSLPFHPGNLLHLSLYIKELHMWV